MIKPILFNTQMVQAICDGRKTVTRRVIKPQPKMQLCYISGGYKAGTWHYPSPDIHKYWGEEWRVPDYVTLWEGEENLHWTPPCHTDDILYVRETWAEWDGGYTYKADKLPDYPHALVDRWYPSIHMPKEAARLFLKVTHVSVERLQNMTLQDSLAEGVKLSLKGLVDGNGQEMVAEHRSDGNVDICGITDSGRTGAMHPFIALWNSTIPKKELPLYGWDANPFVWKIEFERITREEAGL